MNQNDALKFVREMREAHEKEGVLKIWHKIPEFLDFVEPVLLEKCVPNEKSGGRKR